MKIRPVNFSYFLFLVCCFGIVTAPAQTSPRFKYRVAIIGNPVVPDTRWDDKQLSALKKLGFNTVQINIAWGSRPADEPLNLEDILTTDKTAGDPKIAKRLAEMKRRAQLGKKYGFRILFQFGAPRIEHLYQKIGDLKLIDRETDTNSVQRPEIIAKYTRLVTRLAQEIPQIDDIQVYTYDQEAWLGNEFGYGIDRGIPLNERLPKFLQALTAAWAKARPDGRLWWEPWELSAGQIYACIPNLPVQHFGMILHVNIAEAQIAKPVDVWFRNTARMAGERGIPIIGEGFFAGATEEIEPLQNVASTRLVYEQIAALASVPQLVGIKEYYGLSPDKFDPNQSITGLVIHNPTITYNDAINTIAEPFSTGKKEIIAAWSASSNGMQLFPWDASWLIREVPKNSQVQVFHRWDRGQLNGLVAISPSWKSSRRAMFMTTENQPLDPWAYEDIELSAQAAADEFLKAIHFYKQSLAVSPKQYTGYISNSLGDMKIMEQSTRAFQCYFREVNLAALMRPYAKANQEIPADMLKKFRDVLTLDIQNQEKGIAINHSTSPTAREMLELFNQDPTGWVEKYLL
jgi:hypothetical protein